MHGAVDPTGLVGGTLLVDQLPKLTFLGSHHSVADCLVLDKAYLSKHLIGCVSLLEDENCFRDGWW